MKRQLIPMCLACFPLQHREMAAWLKPSASALQALS